MAYKRLFQEEKTNVTVDQLKRMSDDELIRFSSKYPYESMFINKDAFQWLLTDMMYRKGKAYQKTGKKKVFKKRGIY